MAKRKRLTPAQTAFLAPEGPLETKSMAAPPPIAQVSEESALTAALEDLAGVLSSARQEGRFIEDLPLDQIVTDHLMRDRLVAEDDEMAALVDSIRARGQQMPIEVSPLGEGQYGLISGWRRVAALGRLHAETGADRFASVKALVRDPETSAEAYVAMVEENEIRVGLSFYERARIVMRAAHEGVYSSQTEALKGLFGAASPAKRSKIKSFIPLVEGLDRVLKHPSQISERLGLALSKRLSEDPAFAGRLRDALVGAAPKDGAAEVALLTQEVAGKGRGVNPSDRAAEAEEIRAGVWLTEKRGSVVIKGLDAAAVAALRDWLAGPC